MQFHINSYRVKSSPVAEAIGQESSTASLSAVATSSLNAVAFMFHAPMCSFRLVLRA